jgi:membrane dipeptidase
MAEWNISEEAAALHNDALVWDMIFPWMDYASQELKHGTLPRMKASGYNLISLTVAHDYHSLNQTIHKIAKERAYFAAQEDEYIFVETVDDVLRAKAEDKLAVYINFQGTNPIEGDLGMIEVFYKLGVRHMLMAYNIKNVVGDGCTEKTDGGLTNFGELFIQEMNRVGVLVDGSHTGYMTTMDMMEASKDPVVFTHCNACGVFDHHRNLKDDQIKACAKGGGVIGVDGVGAFLGNGDNSIEMLLDHIDYISELVGPKHVGFGIDYVFDLDYSKAVMQNAGPWVPQIAQTEAKEWLDIKYVAPEQMPLVTEGLMTRGYSEGDIRGILGTNWLRVASQVWK